MRRICIDLTNIVPGLGGAGGGISTYSKNLLIGLDRLLDSLQEEIQLIVVGHPRFLGELPLNHAKVFFREVNNQSFFGRFYWLNFSLPKFLKSHKIDVLHRVIPELPLISGVKSIITLHDFMFDFYLSNERLSRYLGIKQKAKFHFLRWLMQKGLKSENLILVPSKSIAKELTSRYPKKKLQVRVTKLGTSFKNQVTSAVLDTEKMKLVNRPMTIGYIAGFYPHKGHKKAIKFLKMLLEHSDSKNIMLHFRGSIVYPAYYEEIREMVKQEGLDSNVVFEKFNPSITLQEIYDHYDVTLLLSEYEGFGLPVLESQTFCKPVLCSDIPVFRENLNGSAYYIKGNFDAKEIENAKHAIFNPQALDRMKSEGMKNSSLYSWDETCRLTLASYLSMLNS